MLKELYDAYQEGEAWISQLPTEISAAFFDNPYASSANKMFETLALTHFGEAKAERLFELLYNSENLSFEEFERRFNQ